MDNVKVHQQGILGLNYECFHWPIDYYCALNLDQGICLRLGILKCGTAAGLCSKMNTFSRDTNGWA